MNNLRQRTLSGLGWNGAARLLGQLLQLAATVVLARLLSPKEYGLLGMVLVFTGFASSVADMGLGASIIQRSTLTDRHLNSVFWLNVAHWGLMGVASAYVLGGFAFILYPTWSSAGRLINLGFKALLRNIAGPFACAASMGVVLWASDQWVFGSWALEMRLATQLILGALLYLLLARSFRLQAWVEVATILLDMGGNRSRLLRWVLVERG